MRVLRRLYGIQGKPGRGPRGEGLNGGRREGFNDFPEFNPWKIKVLMKSLQLFYKIYSHFSQKFGLKLREIKNAL